MLVSRTEHGVHREKESELWELEVHKATACVHVLRFNIHNLTFVVFFLIAYTVVEFVHKKKVHATDYMWTCDID